jgi:hypothetical protein
MTDLLKRAIAALERLPQEEQDAIAQHILDDLTDEAQWEKSFADLRSERFFAEMVRLGDEESAHGALLPAPTVVENA